MKSNYITDLLKKIIKKIQNVSWIKKQTGERNIREKKDTVHASIFSVHANMFF